MKGILLLALGWASSSLTNLAAIAVSVTPAVAQTRDIQAVQRALVSPTNAERFFEAGRHRLEREIQHLQQPVDRQEAEILKINREPLVPPQDWSFPKHSPQHPPFRPKS